MKDYLIYYQNEKGGKIYSMIITLAYDSIKQTEIINEMIYKLIPNAHRAWWN